MSLEGTVTFGAWLGANPKGSCVLIGSNGEEYIAGRTAITIFVTVPVRVGRIDNETIIEDISFADWSTDIAARQPTADTQTMSAYVLPVQGTPYFLIPGASKDVGTAQQQATWLLKKIIDDSTVNTVGSIALGCGVNTGPTVEGVCYGAGVLEDDPGFVYVVVEGGYVSSFTNEVLLLRLPVSETDITDLTPGAINAYQTKLAVNGASHAFVGPRPGERTDSHGDLYTIVPDPDKDAGLLKRVGLAATPGMFYAAVDIGEDLGDHGETAEPAYTGSYVTDVSGPFGMPYSNEGNHLDGTPSGDDHDGFTAPSHLGGGEVVQLRSDSANTSQVYGVRHRINGVSDITSLGTFQFTHNSEIISVFIQALQGFRLSSSEIVVGMRTDNQWIFGSHELAMPPEPGECGPEDQPDDIPAVDVEWDPCLLRAQSITLEILTDTVCPGPALSGRRQYLHNDAGCWKITYHGIKVWTNEELLLWREYESLLNGRVGVVTVAIYEAPLSGTPIAATLGANASIQQTRLTINQSAGATIRKGMHFQVGSWVYVLVSGSGTEWRVWPPLRAAVTSGTELNFNDPRLRCRLATDSEMDINLEHMRFGKVDVRFIEDV